MRNCHECKSKGLDKARYCDEDAPFDAWEINGIGYRRCPVQYVKEESMEALRLYGHYEAGFLPRGGGVLDQPNRLVQQIEIIKAVFGEERQRRLEDARRKQ